jgi:hypothetical protein
MDMTATVAAAAKTGTRKKIARCVHHQPMAPATAAIKAIRDFHYDAKGKSVTFQVPFSRQASEAVVQYY